LAVADREHERLHLRMHPELGQHVLGVRAERVRAHPELRRDLFRLTPGCHRLEDLDLARGEPFETALDVSVDVPPMAEPPLRTFDLALVVDRLAPMDPPNGRGDVADRLGLAEQTGRARLYGASEHVLVV